MDVRRRVLGLAACALMLVIGVPLTSTPSAAAGTLTIDGQYESAGPLRAGEVRNLVVTGRGGVPEHGVGAVALNVTVTNPTDSSFITAWPTGAPRPTAANLNFVAGQTVPNMVVVKVGELGQVSLYNLEGDVDVVVDVMGWFPEGATYTGLTPARLADTRPGYPTIDAQQSGTGRVTAGGTREIPVVGRGGVPATGVGAVALNVTAVSPSAASFLTVWPTGAPRPTSANLNYVAGDVVPNMVIVKVGAGGTVSFFNYAGTTDLVVDVMGWFPETGSFNGLTPARLLDTRPGSPTIDGSAAGEGTVGPNGVRELTVVGRGGVPAAGVGAVVLNVAATNPTDSSFLTVYPSGSARPLAANLNFVAGQTVPNMVIAKVGAGGKISIYNLKGNVDVVVDVMGWFPEGVAYAGLVPARLMDTRPGGTPTTPTLPTTTAPGTPTTQPGTPTTPPATPTTPPATPTTPPSTTPPTTTPPVEPVAWTHRPVDMPVQPRNDTPMIGTNEIFDIEVSGTSVFVLGTFTSVRDSSNNPAAPDTAAIGQRWLVKYDMDTGLLDRSFDPQFDAGLEDMALSPDGASLYVVGRFDVVDGLTRHKVVKLSTTTGDVDASFVGPTSASSRATAVVADANRVYVGGQFAAVGGSPHAGLVALTSTDGAVVPTWDPQLSGGIGAGGLLTVQRLLLTHDGSKLIVVHTARQIDGQDRYGVGMISPATGDLLPWRTTLFQDNLARVGGTMRVYAGAVAPDDTYFVVVSGSGGDRPPINDVAIRFPVDGADGVQPTWISRHFDSVYSVAILDEVVYIGGHFSWAESPRSAQPWPGLTTQGYGQGQGIGAYALGDQVVRREQLAALSSTDGVALEWNPTANGFEGVKAMATTPRGLFIGVDGATVGGRNVGYTAFFDRQTIPNPAARAWVVSPYDGVVVPSGQQFTITGEAVSPTGVDSVQVRIQVRGTSTYVCADGTVSAACGSLTAVVAAPGSTSTTWSLSVRVPAQEFLVRTRVVTAGTTTTFADNQSTLEGYLYDDASPATAILLPDAGLVTTNTFVVSGTANDDRGVASMSYTVYNPDTQQYLQDDGSVSSTFDSFSGPVDTPGAASTTWQLELTLPNGTWRLGATAIDTIGQPDLRSAAREWLIDPSGRSPTLTVTAPGPWNPPVAPATSTPAAVYGPIAPQPGANVTFAGGFDDDQSVAAVFVTFRNTTTGETLAADGTWSPTATSGLYRIAQPGTASGTWSWSPGSVGIQLTPGIYAFRVYALDNRGLSTTSANTPAVSMTVQVPGNAFPDTAIAPSPDGSNPYQAGEALRLDLSGTASDAAGDLAGVRVVINDLDTGTYLTAVDGGTSPSYSYVTLPASGGTANWSLSTALPFAGEWFVTAIAFDAQGQLDTSSTGATWRYLIYPGDADPTLSSTLNSPTDGAVLDAQQPIMVGGRAEDDQGISAVRITIRQNSSGSYVTSTGLSATPTNLGAYLTSPGSPGSNFSYTTESAVTSLLTAGSYTITVTPVDNWGQFPWTPSRIFTVTLV